MVKHGEQEGRGIWRSDFPIRPANWPFFYGWMILAVGALGVFASIPGQTIGVSVFTDYLIEDLGIGRTPLSFAYMIGTIISGFTLPYAGKLFDRLGARKMAVLAAGGLALAACYMGASPTISDALNTGWTVAGTAAIPFAIITVGFFLIRFWGQGSITMTSRAMVGKWFDKRRGLAFGIMGVVMGIVMSASPKMLDALIDLVGWREAYFTIAFLLLFGVAVIAWLFFRDNPEECGLLMDGRVIEDDGKPKNQDLIIKRDFNRAEALRTYSFWVFALTFAWHGMFVTGYSFHVVKLGEEYGFGREEIISLFLLGSPFSVATDLFMGWFSGKTRVKYIQMVECTAMALIGIGVLSATTTLGRVELIPVMPWGLPSVDVAHLLIVLGLGIGGGCFGILSGLIWPRYFGRTHLGAISGFAMSALVIGSALGPIFFSFLRDLFGSFGIPLLISGAVPLLLAIAGTRADNPQRNLPDEPEAPHEA